MRRVEISHNNGVDAEVHSGLSEGDAVIIHPPDSVNDGASVAAKQVVIDNATADRLLMDTIEELLFVSIRVYSWLKNRISRQDAKAQRFQAKTMKFVTKHSITPTLLLLYIEM